MTEISTQLIKSKVTQSANIRKSREARNWLAKRQLNRSGQGNGWYQLQAYSSDGRKGPGDLAKADGRVRTIWDMVDLEYGYMAQKFAGGGQLAKDDSMTTSTTGVANTVFGQEVYSLLNSESNVFGLLSKRPWRKSGERAIDARGHTLGSGGTAENASLPATEKPDFITFEQTAKSVAHTFDVSQIEQLKAATEDDHFADDPMGFLREWYGTGTEHQSGQGEHPKHINAQLLSGVDSTAGNDFESIDRAISDSNESSLLTAASDNDIYGFDRSAGNFEATVDENGGTNRNLTLDIMDGLITSVRKASGRKPVEENSYFWLTDHDAFEIIEREAGPKERLEPVRTQVGMNGVQTAPGDDVGITVNSYKKIPIFRSDDVPSDGVGRVYLIDSDTLWIKQLLPTQYYDTGIQTDNNPFALDRLGDEGMFLTVGELTMTNPAAHAKARDLK